MGDDISSSTSAQSGLAKATLQRGEQKKALAQKYSEAQKAAKEAGVTSVLSETSLNPNDLVPGDERLKYDTSRAKEGYSIRGTGKQTINKNFVRAEDQFRYKTITGSMSVTTPTVCQEVVKQETVLKLEGVFEYSRTKKEKECVKETKTTYSANNTYTLGYEDTFERLDNFKAVRNKLLQKIGGLRSVLMSGVDGNKDQSAISNDTDLFEKLARDKQPVDADDYLTLTAEVIENKNLDWQTNSITNVRNLQEAKKRLFEKQIDKNTGKVTPLTDFVLSLHGFGWDGGAIYFADGYGSYDEIKNDSPEFYNFFKDAVEAGIFEPGTQIYLSACLLAKTEKGKAILQSISDEFGLIIRASPKEASDGDPSGNMIIAFLPADTEKLVKKPPDVAVQADALVAADTQASPKIFPADVIAALTGPVTYKIVQTNGPSVFADAVEKLAPKLYAYIAAKSDAELSTEMKDPALQTAIGASDWVSFVKRYAAMNNLASLLPGTLR